MVISIEVLYTFDEAIEVIKLLIISLYKLSPSVQWEPSPRPFSKCQIKSPSNSNPDNLMPN